MRLLAVDHFFDQDLDALRAALAPGDELVAVPYQRFHRIARRAFDADAFTGVDAAMSESHAAAWQRYRPLADSLTDWLLAAYRPHALVLPSDAIFYLRPVIARAKHHGVPTAVVQKETTISPMVMDQHALAVARAVPFTSDVMTVCSERQREFWVRAGSDPERIVVTGQPRFDVYAQPRPTTPAGGGRPRLLYLSYDDAAYLPSDLGVTYEGRWRDLRRETEETLRAASDRWDVQVKHHPQQPVTEEWLGDRVTRAPRDADTRRLILEADAVVGFQTTALFEAVAARRPVLYAAWGDTFERAEPLLIPFHEHPEAVTHVQSAAELRALLQQPPDDLRAAADAAALEWVTSHIGPVDGNASRRALDVVRATAPTGTPRVTPPAARARRARALGAASAVLRSAAGRNRALRRRASHWAQEGDELRRIRASQG